MGEWTEETTDRIEDQYQNPVAVSCELASAEEKVIIAKILKSCEPEIKKLRSPQPDVVGEHRVLRFLRHEKGSAKETLISFKKFLNIRTENDHFLEKARDFVEGWSSEQMLSWFEKRKNPYINTLPFGGETDKGDIIAYAFGGMNDHKKLLKNRPKNRAMDYEIWVVAVVMEWRFLRLDENSRRHNRLCYVIEVRDMMGYEDNFAKAMLKSDYRTFNSKFFHFADNVWVENHSICIMVNCGRATKTMLGVVKTLLSARHSSKLLVVGEENKKKNKEKFSKYVPLKLQPTVWGGKGEGSSIDKCIAEIRAPNYKEEAGKQILESFTYDIFSENLIDYKTLPDPVVSKIIDPKVWC